uniref:Uncharacterized protein n=1 Tax=Arundo donax TaxID=35708 RepID=A0A0A9T383_ARUDO
MPVQGRRTTGRGAREQ